MDTVTLDGKVYVKAAKAASAVGYTSDYIGQLCRKGALEGIMLGKTWYVPEESLILHKHSQVRANTATTRRDIEKQRNALQAGQHLESHVGMSTSAGYRKELLKTNIRYSPDTHDLLPSVLPEAPVFTSEERSNDTGSSLPQNEAYIGMTDISTEDTEGDFIRKDYPEEANEREEGDEEILVPIRKIGNKPSTEAPIRVKHYQEDAPRTQRSEKEVNYPPDNKKEAVTQAFSRSRVPRHSALPVISIILALLFAAATVVLESTWRYTDNPSKQASIETTYSFASTLSVVETLRQTFMAL